MKEFLAQSVYDLDVEPSHIYHMEKLNENPDSNDTMRHDAEILLDSVKSDSQDGYIVLVGDGKTYEHLMQIKCLYGSELRKLLFFPGDWHTLKNYQPGFTTMWASKNWQRSQGFVGRHLTSLEKCSDFKRTHHFLLQVWQAMYRQN